jgi:hypothetical protein
MEGVERWLRGSRRGGIGEREREERAVTGMAAPPRRESRREGQVLGM